MTAWSLRSWRRPLLGLIGMACAVFVLPHLMPGPPITLYESWPVNAQQRTRLISEYGFDRPLPVQCAIWLQRLVTGQWGISRYYNRPVLHDIARGASLTLLLFLWTLLTSGLVIAGVWCLHRLLPWWSTLLPQRQILQLLEALPGFLVAIALRELIIWQLGWVSMANLPLFEPYYFLNPLYMLLPALPLALTPLRLWYTYPPGLAGARPTLRQRWQYVRGNAHPYLEHFLLEVSLTEYIFAFPGLGSLGIEALKRRDLPVLQGFLLCTGALYVVLRGWCTRGSALPAPTAPPGATGGARPVYHGAWCLVLLIAISLCAPACVRYDPMEIHSRDQFLAPGYRYTLGTDFLGRDIVSRTLQGFRSSMPRVLCVTLCMGSVSWLILGGGHRRYRWPGMVWQGGLALLWALPAYVLAFMVFLICEWHPWALEIALSSAGLPAAARLMAGHATRGQRLAQLAWLGASVLLLEVTFYFLNLHTESYTAAWGSDLRHGLNYGHLNIWMVVAPAGAIAWSRYSLHQLGYALPPQSGMPAPHPTAPQNASEDVKR